MCLSEGGKKKERKKPASVCKCVHVCASVRARRPFASVRSSSGFIPLIFPLSQLLYLCLTLYLAFFFITPFDDEKLIAVPGHETNCGRETENDGEWKERMGRGGARAEGWMDGMSQRRER